MSTIFGCYLLKDAATNENSSMTSVAAGVSLARELRRSAADFLRQQRRCTLQSRLHSAAVARALSLQNWSTMSVAALLTTAIFLATIISERFFLFECCFSWAFINDMRHDSAFMRVSKLYYFISSATCSRFDFVFCSGQRYKPATARSKRTFVDRRAHALGATSGG